VRAVLRRKDITLEECLPNWWVAVLEGKSSRGHAVRLGRGAEHAGEALALLEETVKREGFVLR
jgi:hypothetical protein